MEFFEKAVAVKVKSHLDKYLVAGDDLQTVRQSRSGGSTRAARWLIEHVESNDQVIRLKSCYGRYLTASNTPFLFGTTGDKIVQSLPGNTKDLTIEWKPVRDGFQFKLKSSGGTYLRANGAMPPWRNTVTHDLGFMSSTDNWILWDVEAVDLTEDGGVNGYISTVSTFSPVSGELSGLELGLPISVRSPSVSPRTPTLSMIKTFSQKIPHFRLNFSIKLIKHHRHLIQEEEAEQEEEKEEESGAGVMDLLHNAKTVRLRSHHGKFLHADDDHQSVSQHRNGTSKNARWIVEFVPDTPDNITIIRLKSCYNNYLTASDHHFLLRTTGKKVLQTSPTRLDSSVEWEPIGEGKTVKLKTRYGHYLRANHGLPPWRNSVTHDIPHRTTTQDWQIDILDTTVPSLQLVPYTNSFTSSESSSPSTNCSKSPAFSNQASMDSPVKREEGRAIYYHVIKDKYGDVDEGEQGCCISFKGNRVNELTQKLEEETRLHNITVCSQSPLDGKLYPLRLQLPPNNFTMKVVVVQNSCAGRNKFAPRVEEAIF